MIPRNDHSNLIDSGKIISLTICTILKVNLYFDISVLLRRLLNHDLLDLLVERSIRMMPSDDIMKSSEDV